MSKHDTKFYNYKNIFAYLKKKKQIDRNQTLGMHYQCTKQIVKYIKNRRKHLDITTKHIFHIYIDACTKKYTKVLTLKQKQMIFFFFCKQFRKQIGM